MSSLSKIASAVRFRTWAWERKVKPSLQLLRDCHIRTLGIRELADSMRSRQVRSGTGGLLWSGRRERGGDG